jgi:hypothetical protein
MTFTARDRLRWLGAAAASCAIPARADAWEKNTGVKISPIHQLFLVAVGTPLFDNCDLIEAASDQAAKLRRSTFCMTAAPLCVPGAAGSPFNPLAIF